MNKESNRNRAKFAVTYTEHHTETPLDVLDEFIDWTKKHKMKSYIEIAELLNISTSQAQKILYKAVLPDDDVIKRMKEVMHEH